MSKEYRKPTFQFIGAQAKELYKAETKAMDAIKRNADELGKVMKFDSSELYTHSLPESLANILDSFDHEASDLAAVAYLEKRGYVVTKGASDV